MSEEKRRAARIQPFVAPCRLVHAAQRLPAYLADLSTLGARITCDAVPPPPGAAVALEVRFGREVRHSRLLAEVKWVKAMGDGSHFLGLTFTAMGPAEREMIESVVAEFQRRAEELE